MLVIPVFVSLYRIFSGICGYCIPSIPFFVVATDSMTCKSDIGLIRECDFNFMIDLFECF